MNLTDIRRTLAAQNPGEKLLVEISNALNAGKQPSDKTVRRLDEAVTAMLSQEDSEERLNLFLRKLKLNNREGRPPINKSTKKREQAERMARAYWSYRLQGFKNAEAAKIVAENHQSSGKFREGFPSPDTVERYVKLYPRQSEYAFYYWRMLTDPNKDELKAALDGIKAYLNKNG